MKRIIYEVESGKPGKRVLVVAGVHGDEFEPVHATTQLERDLQGRLLNGKVELVAIANETAYAAGRRHGADGLDMARVFPGDEHGTSTEAAAHGVSEWIKNCDYMIDLHTGGLAYDIFPMAGYMLHPQHDVLEKQRAMALATGLPLVWGTDYRPNGRTLSVARDCNIPAIYFEYGGGTGFRQEVVGRYQKAVMRILIWLGMMQDEHRFTAEQPKYWMEDHRADSGHFQAKMPSPMDGIFIASVSVGDRVSAGQCIGEVVDPLTGAHEQIHANADGMVHFLRVMVRVTKGDALGGVLPVVEGKKEVIHE